MSNIEPFTKKGAFTDFRVLLRYIASEYPDTTNGIIILFDKEKGMKVDYVCKNAELAFAGADLLYRSATEKD